VRRAELDAIGARVDQAPALRGDVVGSPREAEQIEDVARDESAGCLVIAFRQS
jgi:hypothetical protein